MRYIIYQITNKLNGMIYIGKHRTENINDGYMGSGIRIINAINKYGLENFEKTILFECKSDEELSQLEKEIVNEDFIKRDDVYNIQIGGGGGDNYSGKTEEEKEQFRNNVKQALRNIPKEKKILYIKKITNSLKKFHNEHPDYYCGEKNGMYGKKQSDHAKQLISAIMKTDKNYMKNAKWYVNYDLRQNIIVKTGDSIPNGYVMGRCDDFDKYFKKLENNIKKQRLKEYEIKRKKDEVQEMANCYEQFGFLEVQRKFYGKPGTSSPSALIHLFERWGAKYTPQSGIPRPK